MKKFRNLFIAATLLATSVNSVNAEDCCYTSAPAYTEGCDSCYLSAAAPIAVLVIAAVVIATTGRGHHHGSSSSSSSSSHSH